MATAASTEHIKPVAIEAEMRKSYIKYAMSVIVGRALPDVRDGLKPVQRRILYAIQGLGLSSKNQHKKSARIVGECFVKGTLVATSNGLVPIEQVRCGDRVYTERGIHKVVELYKRPPRPLCSVRLETGLSATMTESQLLQVINDDLSLKWKKACELQPNDWVVLKPAFPDNFTRLQHLDCFQGRRMRLDKEFAYVLGQLMSDGWVAHEPNRLRIGFCSADKQVIKRIRSFFRNQFSYEASMEAKRLPSQKILYQLRINRDAINNYLANAFGLENLDATTKNIPELILSSPKPIILSFLSGLIDGDGHLSATRHVIHYGSVSLELIDRLQVLLHCLGFHPKRYLTPLGRRKLSWAKGREIRGKYPFYSLEITGLESVRFANQLDLTDASKRRRAGRLLALKRSMWHSSDMIPNAAKTVFGELSRRHLGGGWYVDSSGHKFRQGVRYAKGARIRYTADLEYNHLHLTQIQEWGILEKLQRLGSPLGSAFRQILDADLCFNRVGSVTPSKAEETYDLEVENEHNFVANGIVAHNCLGKFHPHGDTAVYDALVRLAQHFSMRYPLVDGQGNFGSVDGDEPAAMRYTEARLAKLSEEMLEELEMDTVDWGPNFDDSLKEPLVLPSKFPNLLVNGASGIAVGMSCSIPPHNLSEVIDALTHLVDHPNTKVEDLLTFIKGPDFPTGGIIHDATTLLETYKQGRGSVRILARIDVEKLKGDRKRLVISEIPFQVNKSKIVEDIANLVKEDKLEGITTIRDESSREGIRVTIDLKPGFQPDAVKSQLYKLTQLHTSFSFINLVLVDGRPHILDLKQTLQAFLDYRVAVVERRSKYELKKAEERLNILNGYSIALNNIDTVIQTIKSSDGPEEAAKALLSLKLNHEQIDAILQMKLQQLTRLEAGKIQKESEEKRREVERLQGVLGERAKLLTVLKSELAQLKSDFGDARRTEVRPETIEFDVPQVTQDEPMLIFLSAETYVKRTPPRAFSVIDRGSEGVPSMDLKEQDKVLKVLAARTLQSVVFLTNLGKAYTMEAHEVPDGSRSSRGTPLVNLLQLAENERVVEMVAVDDFSSTKFLTLITKQGVVKRTSLSAFSNVRSTGIIAAQFDEGDALAKALVTTSDGEIVIMTNDGSAIRFQVSEISEMGRTAKGVVGLRLEEGSEVTTACHTANRAKDSVLLIVTKHGYGKRTELAKLRLQKRGGHGVIALKVNSKSGDICAVNLVAESGDVLVVSAKGYAARLKVGSIPSQGRASSGVRIVRLGPGDGLATLAVMQLEEGKNVDSKRK